MEKFKIGDIIKAITNDYIKTSKRNKWIGKITSIDSDGEIEANTLKCKDEACIGHDFWCLDPSKFEVIQESEIETCFEFSLEIANILKLHLMWLHGEKEGSRADLSDANLSDANLSRANLRGADLSDANLRGANLRGANLSDANLRGANLSRADLSDANLSRANLRGANLSRADLSRANLSDANLSRANLSRADLSRANLSDANLSRANLSDAKELQTVRYNEKTAFFALQCPEEGSFVAWKKCSNGVIVKLLIPEDAKRSSATSRKCRASKAIVLAIYNDDGNLIDDEGFIAHSKEVHVFTYKVGETVVPDDFDENRWDECSNGIHFFITRREAELYR